MTSQALAEELRQAYPDILDSWTDQEILNAGSPFTATELKIAIRVSKNATDFLRIKECVEWQKKHS